MEEIQGYLHSVIHYNSTNHYAVVSIKLDQKKDERVVVVGNFILPNKDELCRFYGEYVDHPRFGRQFKVESYEKVMPNDIEGIVRFLASSLFDGVGVKCANKVVEILGEDCLNKIREDASCLDMVDIKQQQRESIIKGIANSTRLDEAIKIFVGHGIPMKYLIKMDAVYGKELVPFVLANPYILIRDIDGLGFKLVDKVAHSLGVSSDDSRRIEALTVYNTKSICFRTKDTYTSKNEIYREALKYVPELDEDSFNYAFEELINRGELVDEHGNIYPYDLFMAEKKIAEYLGAYLNRSVGTIDEEIIEKEIQLIEANDGIEYSLEQRQAIITCINNGISIITGGPGTGKTTVVNAIIKIYESLFNDSSLFLAAPTGRASKRMSELTGKEATTIHRMLKWDLDTNRFEYDEDSPIYGDFLIVDEFSMVDCQLFYHLLAATHPFNKILLIGDDKQLPPVSPGDVLRDLLEMNVIPTTSLVKIHRQDSDSGIIPLCYDVRKGELNKENLNKSDVHFYPCSSRDIREMVLNLVKKGVDEGMSQHDIQVLSPQYDGSGGITSLNDLLRDYFNPHAEGLHEVSIGGTIYREGDKILQLKNQPDDGIYNGDIGYLEEVINENGSVRLVIDFDGNVVTYLPTDFQNIRHAYCMSVHKSQGNEWPYVIMSILPEHRMMLKRKLIYTGISRAKTRLALLGDIRSLEQGVKLIEQKIRKTSLQTRLKEVLTER